MGPESSSSPSLDEVVGFGVIPEIIEEVWFEERKTTTKRPSTPPEPVGEFLGDPLADAWLR
jgi:hypothetical protein